ncbi:hypothetical protein ABZ092_21660 [Streptomyces bobili]|uniref:hypothetical protein n=1 Tax=Streptomyces bobili TaxID=67280 RepID=UPI0033A1BE84
MVRHRRGGDDRPCPDLHQHHRHPRFGVRPATTTCTKLLTGVSPTTTTLKVARLKP